MKATESTLFKLFNGPRQFQIPIFQRTYSWGREQCEQLWKDLERVSRSNDSQPHFIGSVVYIEHGLYQATTAPSLLLIDGQQRLTTVSLIVEALARAVEEADGSEENATFARKVRHYFLQNPDEEGDLRHKLVLSQRDATTLHAIVQQRDPVGERSRRVMENFEFFKKKIAESELTPRQLYEGLGKLVAVDVSLDRNHDNPQLIFESLNSTGLDLSQSDLIRNYLLMGLEPEEQRELYEQQWLPMEKRLEDTDDRHTFDWFLRAWLTLRLGEVPNRNRGYEEFKRHRRQNPEQSLAELATDLHRFSEHYACIALEYEDDPELARIFEGLQELHVDAPMPFLLYAYDLCQRGTLPPADLVEICRLMESWVFRRAVCDIPSNVLSRTFAVLPRQLEEDRLLESLSAWLSLRTERQRFPNDDEFRNALVQRNAYDFKPRTYMLDRFENQGRKEPVDVSEFTTEHILPQNEKLSKEWREMLGEDWKSVQERWLHTLGNLTLTGYNSELSDHSLVEKQNLDGGFKDSPLRLNKGLGTLAHWGPEEIEARARRLADQAVELWPGPRVDERLLEEYRPRYAKKSKKDEDYDIDQFDMEDEILDLYRQFEAGALEMGLEARALRSTITFAPVGSPRKPVAWLYPKQRWLRAYLDVPFASIDDPPSCSRSKVSSRGWDHTVLRLSTKTDVADCLAIAKQHRVAQTGA